MCCQKLGATKIERPGTTKHRRRKAAAAQIEAQLLDWQAARDAVVASSCERRDRPNGAFEIKLDPFGCAELPGTGEQKRHQLQGDSGAGLAVEAINRTEECAQRLWFRNRGARSRLDLN